ncbi:hypothetical protein K1T73_05610 [Roseovarius sp. SCSIO 43702]|uniref:hypothetical protein n=1 Tax=Roseovarius sp. SCSIO 43702 TaxID=2823043 RepID=UPI001C73CF50|nr:hypothetical protein [Roseovarius sp. SCSIO 43702]QYX57865.1 hypothetical protein K1T73_05610 [Roseovarius sp. SCSIO 43702]
MTRFDLDTVRALAEEGIARHGLRGYARKLGLDLGTLRSLRDGRDMQVSRILRILDAMQIGVRMIMPESADRAARGFAEAREGTDAKTAGPEALRMGFLPMPFHPACGDFASHAPIAFSREWLAENGFDPERMAFVRAPDARHSPLLPQDALCLVDTSSRRVGRQALWAHIDGGRVALDFMSQPQPGVMVISGPGPSASPRMLSGAELDNLRLLGQVVWHGALTPRSG